MYGPWAGACPPSSFSSVGLLPRRANIFPWNQWETLCSWNSAPRPGVVLCVDGPLLIRQLGKQLGQVQGVSPFGHISSEGWGRGINGAWASPPLGPSTRQSPPLSLRESVVPCESKVVSLKPPPYHHLSGLLARDKASWSSKSSLSSTSSREPLGICLWRQGPSLPC